MARKGAGTETRPLASILLMKVETKRSIPLLELRPELRPTDRRLALVVRRFASDTFSKPPTEQWCQTQGSDTSSTPSRLNLGEYGMTWVYMGVNGSGWPYCGQRWAGPTARAARRRSGLTP